ncbi:hypothetical protein A6769_00195 [Nostoc punctiforme NIES-2108]|uniref:Uncharacterized protein n=1 Tax=Nostoc punctiforme NIES-2108 TaxID=1356359 RepID=A0A367RXX1_NOSPU|nr:hypothetical protein A6769_00195 [Nostoc punctiforme NIES-2108]
MGSRKLGETRLIASVQELGVIKIDFPFSIYAIFSLFFNAKPKPLVYQGFLALIYNSTHLLLIQSIYNPVLRIFAEVRTAKMLLIFVPTLSKPN